MSSYQPPDPGDKDKYLTQDEREQLQRLMSQPEEFPRELGSWVTDYVGTNAFLQKSQVQGLPLLNTQVQDALDTLDAQQDALSNLVTQVSAAQITATEGTEASELALNTQSATSGQPIIVVSSGTYLILYGCEMKNDNNFNSYYAIYIWDIASFVGSTLSTTSNPFVSVSSFTIVNLPSGGTIGAHYWTESATGRWRNRNLVALRIGA